MANHKILSVVGIGPNYVKMLAKADSNDTDGLLDVGCSEQGWKDLVRRVPTLKEVIGWIEYAKELPPKVTH